MQKEELISFCRAVSQRAAQTLKWAEMYAVDILSAALDHLTLGRAALYEAILERSAAFTPLQRPNETAASNNDERGSGVSAALQTARRELDAAVSGLRRAGQQFLLVQGLLTRAWLRFLTGACTGPESAPADLDEAWEIAERGPMKLFMADILLTRCRLFGMPGAGAEKGDGGRKYPWDKNLDGSFRGPKDDLAEARKLIERCGYWRRKEELEDAERALGC
jgi:hypothetical protein